MVQGLRIAAMGKMLAAKQMSTLVIKPLPKKLNLWSLSAGEVLFGAA